MDAKPMEAADTVERKGGKFIPLTRQAVIADLCNDPDVGHSREDFAAFALQLQRVRNRGYRALAESMRHNYLPFSPDRDTVRVLRFSSEDLLQKEEMLSAQLLHLLERANYRRLSTDELNDILNADNPYSLRISVDLAEYDELQVHVRDEYTTDHSVRRPDRLYLIKAHYRIVCYRRLFLFLKLKSIEERAAELVKSDGISEQRAIKKVKARRKQLPPKASSDFVYMKVFKDLPQHDLQILFPLRRVEFRPFDKIKFFATAGGGTAFGIFSTTGKVLAATNPFAAIGALVGFIGLVGRQVTKFFNQRTQYLVELAHKLFFHNLANNRAALALLLDRAEEEDVKEDLIAFYFNAGETFPEDELPERKAKIDQRIFSRYNVVVDFEIDDALRRFINDGVVTHEGGTYSFMSMADAAVTYRDKLQSGDEEAQRHVCEPVENAELALEEA